MTCAGGNILSFKSEGDLRLTSERLSQLHPQYFLSFFAIAAWICSSIVCFLSSSVIFVPEHFFFDKVYVIYIDVRDYLACFSRTPRRKEWLWQRWYFLGKKKGFISSLWVVFWYKTKFEENPPPLLSLNKHPFVPPLPSQGQLGFQKKPNPLFLGTCNPAFHQSLSKIKKEEFLVNLNKSHGGPDCRQLHHDVNPVYIYIFV